MLISDIHLRDYHRFNKYGGQRLDSFPEYARDVVKIGKKKGITTLICGGDIIDKNTLTPKEMHSLFEMFFILAKQFRIYSVVGNHDARSKKGINKEDTVITLLESIDGITFHHQEVLDICGRRVAFENWMPEYTLDWLKEKPDMYISHATIDYDQTGLYGMDTTPFEDKFDYGFFGDIHVNRQLGNFISIGNTKQESLSDRHQGGVMILDMETMKYERVPIDPKHEKYLHLVQTTDEDEEGWVDFEGKSMVYRVYRPEKVKGEAVEFTLPEVTDIEAKLEAIMKELGLIDLHEDIKSETNYNPIDFNFNLTKLLVYNYRSIDFYSLDFKEDYLITGHNGSGKSTLIMALFRALIGDKFLKKDIKFGEDSCKLVLHLVYQKIEYIITRGTATGVYGLSVDGVELKYNTKAEFEKDVFVHLPFLEYHESFFFNYWDTELLGSMKLDRRFDLLAKYYRLDALANYNDIATIRHKELKRKIKLIQDELGTNTILRDSKKLEVETLLEELKDNLDLSQCNTLIDTYDKCKLIKSETASIKESLDLLGKELSKLEYDFKVLESNLELQSNSIDTDLTKEELEKLISDYETRKALCLRVDKGTELTNNLTRELDALISNRSVIEEQIKGLGSLEKLELKSDILSNLSKDKSSLESVTRNRLTIELNLASELEEIENSLKDNEQKLITEKSIPEDQKKCGGCGGPISNDKIIKKIESDIVALNKRKVKATSENEDFIRSESSYISEVNTLTKSIESYQAEITKINDHNNKVLVLEVEAKDLNLRKSNNESRITKLESEIEVYTSTLSDIKIEISKIEEVSSEDNYSHKSNLDKINKVEELTLSLAKVKLELDEKSKDTVTKKLGLEKDLKALDKSAKKLGDISEEDYIKSKLLISKYLTLDKEKVKLSSLEEAVKTSQAEYDKNASDFKDLDIYCSLTSRSGEVIKTTLEDLTKTFSKGNFRFTTAKIQASGKVVTDMSVEYLVGKRWVSYNSLSSGQKTLCDLYYISKVVTGVGIISFDETLRFLDEENLQVASDIITSMKKRNLLLSSHSSNLSMEGVTALKCELLSDTTSIEVIV